MKNRGDCPSMIDIYGRGTAEVLRQSRSKQLWSVWCCVSLWVWSVRAPPTATLTSWAKNPTSQHLLLRTTVMSGQGARLEDYAIGGTSAPLRQTFLD